MNVVVGVGLETGRQAADVRPAVPWQRRQPIPNRGVRVLFRLQHDRIIKDGDGP